MIAEIYNRRSIRKFLDRQIERRDIEEIIESGIKAPSSKNRQPWKYVVVQGEAKKELLAAFHRGIEREAAGGADALLPQSREHLLGARQTAAVMEQAPVIICVVNTLGKPVTEPISAEDRIGEICNVQSIGASVENMLLAATEKGIGSLWICDTYFAYPELRDWLSCEGDLVAAVAFGYPAEAPAGRPRKKTEDTILWRE